MPLNAQGYIGMKFKFKNTLLVSFLAIAGILGVSSALINKQVNQEPVAEKAEAYSYYDNPTIYFCPSDNWIVNGGERFYINIYNGATYKGVTEATKVESGNTCSVHGHFYGRKFWKATLPNAGGSWPSGIQILRKDSTGSTQWNYTARIDFNSSSEFVLMTNASASMGDNWGLSSNCWWASTSRDAIEKTSDQSPSTSTTRIFFNNADTAWSDDNACCVRAWGGSAEQTWGGLYSGSTLYNFTGITDNGNTSYWYGYADVPQDITKFQIVHTNSAADNYGALVSVYSSTEFTIAEAANHVIFGWADHKTCSAGGAKGDSTGSVLMKAVIEGINTCSDNAYSGYNSYSNVNTNFYSHATDAAKSVSVTSLGGSSAAASVHMAAMLSRSSVGLSKGINGISPFSLFGDSENNYSTLIIVIASSVALLSVTALSILVIRKRKTKEQ